MTRPARLLSTLLVSFALACGGSTTGGSQDLSGSSPAGDGGGTSHDLSGAQPDGAVSSSGDCSSNADCPGGSCVALYPGGFRTCATPPTVATSCGPGLNNKCCKSSDCTGAGQQCFAGPVIPECTGVAMLQSNVCASNECQTAANCANNGVCVPAGALGFKVNGCLAAGCHTDSDCTAQAGGVCAPIKNSCCGAAIGLYCVYPGTGCRSNSDCKAGNRCTITGSTAACAPGVIACPG